MIYAHWDAWLLLRVCQWTTGTVDLWVIIIIDAGTVHGSQWSAAGRCSTEGKVWHQGRTQPIERTAYGLLPPWWKMKWEFWFSVDSNINTKYCRTGTGASSVSHVVSRWIYTLWCYPTSFRPFSIIAAANRKRSSPVVSGASHVVYRWIQTPWNWKLYADDTPEVYYRPTDRVGLIESKFKLCVICSEVQTAQRRQGNV